MQLILLPVKKIPKIFTHMPPWLKITFSKVFFQKKPKKRLGTVLAVIPVDFSASRLIFSWCLRRNAKNKPATPVRFRQGRMKKP